MIQTLVLSVSLSIVVSALCSLCQAVLYSITQIHIEMLKKSGHATAEHLQNLKSDIDGPITALLSLNIAAKIIGASIASASSMKIFGDGHLILFFSALTLAFLIFSEILPKTIGTNYAFKLAPYVTYPICTMVTLVKPIIWLWRTISRLFSKKRDESLSREDLQSIVALSQESGELEENEKKIINNIIDLKNKIVRQVMTPRTVTFSLNEHTTVANAVTKLTELNVHSRIPIYNREPNNVTGIVMRKDILHAAAKGKNKLTVARFKHPAHFVPETARLNRILVDFFDRRQHLFIVVDEYGTMTGVISMEDVLEEIVGMEIVDESDKAKDMRELARARNIESRKNLKRTSKNQGLS